ncbi:hypothetical protein LKD23_07395 [Faecalibacterium sp. CLA-AA-H233]|uniref:Uncharacterized protein n=1 Tax=Faecalibacterium butyricigenerans TaxID=1851427 RepID=A0ABS8F9X5_9FIRM|nr:hypothetical protein [Faecalibacterium sp. CLA-AA-H233]MCC2199573.1 hypothetical protein [Faecalibacterium sp. CLA-AA-H233]
MVKRNGKNGEHLTALNVPHLRGKIKKTCANRPVSCVNGEDPTERVPFGEEEAPLLLFRGRHGILGKEKPADWAGKRRMVS